MSALWLVGLGASIGYMTLKRQRIGSALENAVKEHDGKRDSDYEEVRAAARASAKDSKIYDERLPEAERVKLELGARQMEQEARAYDQSPGPPSQQIQGVAFDGFSS